jgi:porin
MWLRGALVVLTAGMSAASARAQSPQPDPPVHAEPSDPSPPGSPAPSNADPAGERAEPGAEPRSWAGGDHLTGEWGGARTRLADLGVTIDLVYASDLFTARGEASALGHIDAAITLDLGKLAGWTGATLYALGQNNHGDLINDHVGSAIGVTNLEAAPYTQLTELFLEQSLLDDRLKIRVGKQDTNRDFGTPRFGGNFINNNFGMFPNSPLPSYPATGLGAIVIAQPAAWLTGKLAIYEASPEVGGLGLGTAFGTGAGIVTAASITVTHRFGPGHRDGGTTSLGAWLQNDDEDGVGVIDPQRFHDNAGWFVQHDERIYVHPEDRGDPRGATVILRYSGARADRSAFPHYAGGSAAWHGIGPRDNDTVGIGGGYFTIAQQVGGTPGRGSEGFL